MSGSSNPSYVPKLISATTTIKSSQGELGSIFISSASDTPTITIYDGTSTAGTKIVETFTPAAATSYPLPGGFSQGLHVVLGGSISCTVFYV